MDVLYFHGGAAEQKTVKSATNNELYEMGIPKDNYRLVADLEELRRGVPNIVIAEGAKGIRYLQEKFREQTIEKGHKYVMGISIFEQLHKMPDPRSGEYIKILKPAKIKFKNMYKPYTGQDLTDKVLFVSRTGGVGDLLFIQPSLRYLKEKFPSCYIIFACGPQYQDMVDTWECVDEVINLPYSVSELVDSDYHAIFEGVIERCFEAHAVNAYILFSRWLGLELSEELLVPKQEPVPEKVQAVESILNKFERKNEKGEVVEIVEWGLKKGEFIITQPRASSPVRTPRPEVWISLINQLTDRGHKIVITDVPRKKELYDHLVKMCKNPDKVFNFCEHSKDVGYLIALTSLAKMALSCDTALMHIAESVGVKSFGIYGAFPGRVRLSTYKHTQWLECMIGCAPCYIHGQNPCYNHKEGYGVCYDTLDVVYASDQIEEHLKGEK